MTRLNHNRMMLQCVLWLLAVPSFAASPWDIPVTTLTSRIEAILGPGQAQLQVRNISSIPASDLPAIQKQFEAEFRAHGLLISGKESANFVRITFSENARNLVWVAEVIEGNRTQVAMVNAGPLHTDAAPEQDAVLLQGVPVLFVGNESSKSATEVDRGPLLSALSVDGSLALLQVEAVTIYAKSPAGYVEAASFPIAHGRPLGRDPRGMLLSTLDGKGFTAYLPGVQCKGASAGGGGGDNGAMAMTCRDSDEPWPIANPGLKSGASQRAFYNDMRNSFTGVVTPGLGLDLPPFLNAVEIVRESGTVMLLSVLDGGVDVVENGKLKPLSGSRDWGSDYAVLTTSCSAGPIVLASESGTAAGDSLRAYTIAGQAAVPVSEPLPIHGTVTDVASQPDGSVLGIIRVADQSGLSYYEVLRVTTICN